MLVIVGIVDSAAQHMKRRRSSKQHENLTCDAQLQSVASLHCLDRRRRKVDSDAALRFAWSRKRAQQSVLWPLLTPIITVGGWNLVSVEYTLAHWLVL